MTRKKARIITLNPLFRSAPKNVFLSLSVTEQRARLRGFSLLHPGEALVLWESNVPE